MVRIYVEELIDLRTTLRYLGVPIIERSYMFGDNRYVFNSSMCIYAKLHKRHNALSFNRVRESITAGICCFIHLNGEYNPTDILSKNWSYDYVWTLLRPLMFWYGDTAHIPSKEETSNWWKYEYLVKLTSWSEERRWGERKLFLDFGEWQIIIKIELIRNSVFLYFIFMFISMEFNILRTVFIWNLFWIIFKMTLWDNMFIVILRVYCVPSHFYHIPQLKNQWETSAHVLCDYLPSSFP